MSGPSPWAMPACWQPWIDLFIVEQRSASRRPLTIRQRLKQLAMLARAHPDSGPLTITHQQLADFLAAQHWAPATTHNFRAGFIVFFRFMHERGHRTDNPAAHLLRVKVPRGQPRPCPDQVIRTALASAADPRARLAIRIAAQTGLRRAEIARVRTTDVLGDPGRYVLHVADGKGGHQRAVPINDNLAALLLSSPTRYVFARDDNHTQPLSADWIGELVSRALPDQWATHSLRHHFATAAYRGTRDLRAVQELLGHTSPVTTAIYTAIDGDSLRAAAMAALVLTE